MTGPTEGDKKAAETRGHESLNKASQKDGEHSHGGKSYTQNHNATKSNQNKSTSQSNRSSRNDD